MTRGSWFVSFCWRIVLHFGIVNLGFYLFHYIYMNPILASAVIALSSYLPPDFTQFLDSSKEETYTTLKRSRPISDTDDIYTPVDISCTYEEALKHAVWDDQIKEMNFSVPFDGKSVQIRISESAFMVWSYRYKIQANLFGKVFKNIKVKRVRSNNVWFCISARIGWFSENMEVPFEELCRALDWLLKWDETVVFDDITSLRRVDGK